MGDTRVACRVLVGKPEGKRRLGRPTRRWQHNIKTDLKETGWKNIDWINLVQFMDNWRVKMKHSIVLLNRLKPGGYYMYHQFNNHKSYVLPTQCIYVFSMDLRTNSDYFPVQH